jgi:endonuclease/exonuclease/phosphatase family metal-dependent hydrolase
MRRNATREIVQVNFQTAAGRNWAVFGSHWPSRSGGRWESAGYREIAGETLGFFHDRVLEMHGPATPVLVMGDFNDEPSTPPWSPMPAAPGSEIRSSTPGRGQDCGT